MNEYLGHSLPRDFQEENMLAPREFLAMGKFSWILSFLTSTPPAYINRIGEVAFKFFTLFK